jgi:hypothetical protein
MGAFDQRPRFFEGQYLTADDLDAVVAFLRGADVRHALGAHTWGVAIGMHLAETSAPGLPNRVDVTLQPGFAWDGFGRSIVVTQPMRVPESLFADIAYNAALDDTTTGGKGRLVKVWVTYDEIGARAPAPGFETCAEGDVNSRVQETFRFVIGDVPALADRRAPIDIGGQSLDAQEALHFFDPNAPLLYDTSVPHQTPPDALRPPRWLIPIGYVRWIARQNDVGYFVARNLNPADNAADRIRAFRRYCGAVAEYIEAADGAIVMHRRGERPDLQHRFAFLLNGGNTAELLRDLVWVEGNLRVEGDVKLAAGRVLFRDADGLDQHTPLYLARQGDDPPLPADGNRELRAVIGPDSQVNNRFVVGPEQPGASPPNITPNFVVVSSGDVGIGRADPKTRLNVVGARIRLQDTAVDANAKRIELRTDAGAVDLQSTTHSLFIRANGPPPNNNNVVINPMQSDGDGRVGIRVAAPAYELDVKAKGIKLGLEEDGGGQLLLLHNPNDNKIFLEGFSADGNGTASEMLLTGRFGARVPQFTIQSDLTYTAARLGVGTPTPRNPLGVRATGIAEELVSFEAPNGVTKWHINQNLNGNLPGLNFVETGVLDGRLFLAAGGNVGVGTVLPQQRLHVAGPFLRVDGMGNEQAYIGGDASGPPLDVQIGSFNAAVGMVHFWNIGYAGWMDIHYRNEFAHSDAKAKKNVETLGGALARVTALRGVSFEWKRAAEQGAAGRHLGLIAQEVEQVVPEAVSYARGEGAVSYTALVPLLIEAVKELEAEVRSLRERIGAPAAARAAAAKPAAAKPRRRRSPRT